MSTAERRERERAQRHQLIITAARELAEREGWDAVTTRRLADQVEYSQPVLYSHFKGKDAIVRAVALEGFASMAAELRAVRRPDAPAREAIRSLAEAYLRFAAARPALYDAMFTMPVDLVFADPTSTPPALQEAFGEVVASVRPAATDGHPLDIFAEVVWSTLHGLATLTRGGRLPESGRQARLDLLVDRLAGQP
jgi:AcrR family transcriptional regulator